MVCQHQNEMCHYLRVDGVPAPERDVPLSESGWCASTRSLSMNQAVLGFSTVSFYEEQCHMGGLPVVGRHPSESDWLRIKDRIAARCGAGIRNNFPVFLLALLSLAN